MTERQQKVDHLHIIRQLMILERWKKKSQKVAYEQMLSFNSNFLRVKWQEGEEWSRSGLLITFSLIIDADRIIPLLIPCSPVDRHSNLIAGQQITHWNNLVSVSIWSVGLHFSSPLSRVASPGYPYWRVGKKNKKKQTNGMISCCVQIRFLEKE